MAEEIRLDIVSVAHSKGLTDAARDMRSLRGETDKLGDSFDDTRGEAFDFNAEIVRSRARIRELNQEFARSGDRTLFRDLRRERSALRELERIAKNIIPGGERGLNLPALDFSKLISESRGAIIAGLVGVAALASPAIGAMIAGAVAGTVAGGGIIGGVVAAAQDNRVRQAWHDFAAQLTADAFGGAAMAGPTIAAIETLKSAFADLNLDETFAKGAPALQLLADGVAGFAYNLMPGFNAVMDDSEAIMGVFGAGLSDTGDAISDLLTDIVSSKGTLEGLHYLFMVINGSIRAVGNTLEFLGNIFHGLIRISASFTGAMEDVFDWIQRISSLGSMKGGGPLGDVFRWMNDNMEKLKGTAPLVASGMTGIVEPTKVAGGAAAVAAADWEAAAEGLKKLNEQLFTAQGFMIDADEAADRVNRGMLDLTESVKKDGTSLDEHTDKGLSNRQMLRDRIQDLRNQYEADVKSGMAAADASLKYNAQANALQNTVVQMGFAADSVATLIGQLKQIPPTKNIDLILSYQTQGIPIGEHSGQRFNETYRITPYGFQEYAHGGMVAGAYGSPQLAVVHGGERVLTPEQQRSWGGGRMELVVRSGGSALDDLLVQILSRAVQIRGGDGAVLGIRTVAG